MERIRFYIGLILLYSSTTVAQQNHATIFLPGIVSMEGNDFNACFSKDGESFYFSRTIGTKTQLHVTRHVDDVWSAPERLFFCDSRFAYADPAFSSGGELYFISDMPATPTDSTRDYDIWKTSFQNNRWTDPVNVKELNSSENEFYISFTSQGDVYFSSSRKGGFGEEDIYIAKRRGDGFESPVNLGATVNTIHSEYDPFISLSGAVLIFASSGREESFGKADLYWCRRNSEWGETNHFDERINSPSRDYCPYIAHDGSFFFSSEGQVKFITKHNLPKEIREEH